MTGHVADGIKANRVSADNRPFPIGLAGGADIQVFIRFQAWLAIFVARRGSSANVIERVGTNNALIFWERELGRAVSDKEAAQQSNKEEEEGSVLRHLKCNSLPGAARAQEELYIGSNWTKF